MRIEELSATSDGDRRRVSATVVWEQARRRPERIWFEVPAEFGDGLADNPNAFLIASVPAALHFGERRVAMDLAVCPTLREGLDTAMQLLQHWHYPGRARPMLEVPVDAALEAGRAEGGAGLMFSGGLDAYAALCANREEYPVGHRESFSHGLIAYGLELDDPGRFDIVLRHLEQVADESELVLVPVFTNIYLRFRHEDEQAGFRFWRYTYQGAALAAVGHALAGALQSVSVGASDSIPALRQVGSTHFTPIGSHPLIDPRYSCARFPVRYLGIGESRLGKAERIARCPYALANLRVCNQFQRYRVGSVNCGRCEKCVRTMLELLAVGALDQTDAFGRRDLPIDLVAKAVRIRRREEDNLHILAHYMELLRPLRSRGHHGIAAVIEEKILRASRARTRSEAAREWAKEMDRRFFGGAVGKTRSYLRRR